MTVGSSSIFKNTQTIVDSGTTLLVGSTSAVKTFWAAVPGSAAANDGSGTYTYPCDSQPTVVAKYNGKSYTIGSEYFNLGTASDGSSSCVGAVADIGTDDLDVFIMG